jgi:hypothetical protein
MARNVRANIELGLNIVVAIAVVVVAGVVVKRSLFQQPVDPGSGRPQITAGERLTVPNVDWEQNRKSLVFFLKKDCVYCTSSAPFYRQLIEEASKRNVKCLAILPDSIEEAREYVKSLELAVDIVPAGMLPTYKVDATPTVLFVDHQGIVKSVWIGAAAPGREKQMRDQLVSFF